MKRFIDSSYLGLLILFLLAGCWIVPFHGDESTIIYMSQEVDFLRKGDLAHALYRDGLDPKDPGVVLQALRIVNGVGNRYVYGLMWTAAGFSVSDLPGYWWWGMEWEINRAQHNIPLPTLLFVCRWGSALLGAFSIPLVFLIAKRAGGRRTAYLAAFIYTMTPAVLLNSRRAMFETALLTASVLLVYVAQRLLAERSWRWRWIIALGVAAGLTVAAKHTGLLAIGAVFVALVLYRLLKKSFPAALVMGIQCAIALVIAFGVFFVLNPVWWNEPLKMPERVLAGREDILKAQLSTLGGFTDTGSRVSALVRHSLSDWPQYFEVPTGWPLWIHDQIVRYEASFRLGLAGPLYSLILGALILVGTVRATIQWRNADSFVLVVVLVLTLATTFVLTPFDWQRYYLPLAAPVALIAGMAICRPVRRAPEIV